MGFLRRHQRNETEALELPHGLEIPEGMTAVSDETAMEWASQLADEGSEMAVTKQVPDFVDLAARVCLAQLFPKRAASFSGGTQLLGYNLVLLGYWCRAAEMQAVRTDEASPNVTGYLEVAYNRGLWGEDWFATLVGASNALAGLGEEDEAIVGAFRSGLPDDLGDDFRRYYAAVASRSMSQAISGQHPGASNPLEPADLQSCWRTGYWMRALSVSLPEHAHGEFGSP